MALPGFTAEYAVRPTAQYRVQSDTPSWRARREELIEPAVFCQRIRCFCWIPQMTIYCEWCCYPYFERSYCYWQAEGYCT